MKSSNIHLNLFSPSKSEHGKYAWDHENREKLTQFIHSNGGCTAVFDADGTLWAGDASEAFFRWLVAERKLVNVNYDVVNYDTYLNRVSLNPVAGYKWLVTTLAGMEEKNIIEWANQFFNDHFISRIYAPQKELIDDLKKQNCDVWIVSASHEWIVKAGAQHLGVHPSKVIGVRLAVENGLLTDKILEPFTYHEGKVTAIHKYIPNRPSLIFGDSLGDIPMLKCAEKLAVFINHNENDLAIAEIAKSAGCMIQYFPLLPDLEFQNKVDRIVNHTI